MTQSACSNILSLSIYVAEIKRIAFSRLQRIGPLQSLCFALVQFKTCEFLQLILNERACYRDQLPMVLLGMIYCFLSTDGHDLI